MVHSVFTNDFNFLMKCLDCLSFSAQYGRSTNMNGVGAAKKNVGIKGISSSSSLGFGLMKLSIIDDTKFLGNLLLHTYYG